jgi:hypothetical protein
MRPEPLAVTVGAAAVLLFAGIAPAAEPPQELSVSAKVDKTTVEAGTPLNFALTITGDLTGANVPPPEFPEGFEVAGRTQATNVSVQMGAIQRSTSLVYVLVPTRAGTFQLGPFSVEQRGRTFETQPIEITVKQPPLPPTLKPDSSGRYTI